MPLSTLTRSNRREAHASCHDNMYNESDPTLTRTRVKAVSNTLKVKASRFTSYLLWASYLFYFFLPSALVTAHGGWPCPPLSVFLARFLPTSRHAAYYSCDANELLHRSNVYFCFRSESKLTKTKELGRDLAKSAALSVCLNTGREPPDRVTARLPLS